MQRKACLLENAHRVVKRNHRKYGNALVGSRKKNSEEMWNCVDRITEEKAEENKRLIKFTAG